MATMDELERIWSYEDIMKANAHLDIRYAIEKLTIKGIPKHDSGE